MLAREGSRSTLLRTHESAGKTPDALRVTYTNWNLTGDQAAGIKMMCSTAEGWG